MSAIISPCFKYRYNLQRVWASGPQALFIMLNPSTADSHSDDPTLRRCIGFASREGCGRLRVENLFGFRSPSPKALQQTNDDPVGDADHHIVNAVGECEGPVIVAWGGFPFAQSRAKAVLNYLTEGGCNPLCLGVTSSGAPRHPLYVPKDTPLIPYRIAHALKD